MDKVEQGFQIEDMKCRTADQMTWKLFVKKFGAEGFLWMCREVNGGKIYVPEIDTQLKGSRRRAYKNND